MVGVGVLGVGDGDGVPAGVVVVVGVLVGAGGVEPGIGRLGPEVTFSHGTATVVISPTRVTPVTTTSATSQSRGRAARAVDGCWPESGGGGEVDQWLGGGG